MRSPDAEKTHAEDHPSHSEMMENTKEALVRMYMSEEIIHMRNVWGRYREAFRIIGCCNLRQYDYGKGGSSVSDRT
jgi:hypothetical protein